MTLTIIRIKQRFPGARSRDPPCKGEESLLMISSKKLSILAGLVTILALLWPVRLLLAQRVVQAPDQASPGTVTGASTPTARPELKVYTTPKGRAKMMAQGLQEEYGNAAGVRIVPDEQTSQLLVVAPPEIHARIAGRLAASERVADPAPSVGRDAHRIPNPQSPIPSFADPAPSAGRDARRPAREIQLTNLTAQRLEAALTAMLGSRFSMVGGGSSDLPSYRVAASEGQSVEVSIDRQSNRVNVAGMGAAVDSFVRLVRALDGPQLPVEESLRIVPIKTTKAVDARRAVEAIQSSNTNRRGPAGETSDAVRSQLPLAAQLLQSQAKPGPEALVAAAPAQRRGSPIAARDHPNARQARGRTNRWHHRAGPSGDAGRPRHHHHERQSQGRAAGHEDD